MDRCAVFVDAGYLYAEGGKLSGIGPSRRNVRLDALRANERTPSGTRNQSRDLAREADEIIMLTKEDLSGFIVEAPDTGEVPTVPTDAAPAVAIASAAYAEQWLDRATDDDVASLMANRPYIPTPLDADLLRAIESSAGVSLRGQDLSSEVLAELSGRGSVGAGQRRTANPDRSRVLALRG